MAYFYTRKMPNIFDIFTSIFMIGIEMTQRPFSFEGYFLRSEKEFLQKVNFQDS